MDAKTKNSILELIETVAEKIKAVFKDYLSAEKEIENEISLRSMWSVEWDTRRNSQIIDRKPAFAIQKII